MAAQADGTGASETATPQKTVALAVRLQEAMDMDMRIVANIVAWSRRFEEVEIIGQARLA